MIGIFLLWFVAITLLGWVSFPLAYRIFPALYDRGFAFSRVLGLLTWGFLFWLGGSLGFWHNDLAGQVMALLLMIALSGFALRGSDWQEMKQWISAKKQMIIVVEVLFFVAFALMALLRSGNPEIAGTEKPMEFAFINSILRSDVFPPEDPWLAGYSISYYYFGYVMTAMLIRITGTLPEVGFNLAVSLWFAMIAVGAYGVVYNLLPGIITQRRTPGAEKKHHYPEENQFAVPSIRQRYLPVLAPILVLIMSNLTGALDVAHSRGIFWARDAQGQFQSEFWSWLDIKELTTPPSEPLSWMPQRPGGILWWRASRVLQDYTYTGADREIIDEFPFFSFLLGDLHPHVLAYPFAILAIALALNIFLKKKTDEKKQVIAPWLPLALGDLLVAGFILGSLAFLNTWDFPIYVVLFVGALVLRRIFDEGFNKARFGEFITLGLGIGITGVVLYLPFYIGFSSQAGGILPSMLFQTRGAHLWVMFGTLFVPILLYMIGIIRQNGIPLRWGKALAWTAGIFGGLFVLMLLYGWIIASLPGWGTGWAESANLRLARLGQMMVSAGQLFLGVQGAPGAGELLSASLVGRLAAPGGWITLFVLTLLALARLLAIPGGADKTEGRKNSFSSEHIFVIVLILMGTVLVTFPEFFYLRDQFGWRMNTIFKFYYQAWLMWSLAAAVGVISFYERIKTWRGVVAGSFVGLFLCLGLVYPVLGIHSKTNFGDDGAILTLDGMKFMQDYAIDDYLAIRWLRSAPYGVITEAVGGSYSGYDRVSAYSGMPTLLGWPGHESQWRGGATEMGTRQTDIERLYQTTSLDEAMEIIRAYNIRYIYIGSYERSAYRVNIEKFSQNWIPVYQNENVLIYEVPGYELDGK